MNDEAVVAFDGVDFSYANSKTLFQNLSLSLRTGGFHVLKGPSGAGKSTLLRLVNRLEEPTAGCIYFKGRPLADYSSAASKAIHTDYPANAHGVRGIDPRQPLAPLYIQK